MIPDSPEGYHPYEQTEFPPKILEKIAEGLVGVLIIYSIFYYDADSTVFYIALLFGFLGNLYSHESIHYLVQSWWGYDPVFQWPNSVFVPDVGLSTREGVTFLIAPQILTIVYVILISHSQVPIIDFMLVIALITNLVGGLRDIAWVIRRIFWPKGHLVLVSSDGGEFVSFPK